MLLVRCLIYQAIVCHCWLVVLKYYEMIFFVCIPLCIIKDTNLAVNPAITFQESQLHLKLGCYTRHTPIYLSIYLPIYLSIYGSTALVDLGSFFIFLISTQSVRLLGRGISPSHSRYLHTEQHKQNKRTLTSMPRVGFEPTTPVFERAKTFYALDSIATAIGTRRT
jgi:hypothetical protein